MPPHGTASGRRSRQPMVNADVGDFEVDMEVGLGVNPEAAIAVQRRVAEIEDRYSETARGLHEEMALRVAALDRAYLADMLAVTGEEQPPPRLAAASDLSV